MKRGVDAKLTRGSVSHPMSEDASHDTPRAGLSQHPHAGPLAIGLDVGSTTVKVVAMDPRTREVLHRDYQRHHTRQPEKVLAMLRELEHIFPESPRADWQIFGTGSGASPLCPVIGGRFVQEVNAVVLADEGAAPRRRLGDRARRSGREDHHVPGLRRTRRKAPQDANPSMNDKCASGTGATIDKCMIKVGLRPSSCAIIQFDDSKLHHVAAKCGVFAETDIVNLVKSGVPAPEILCSLADAIVLQNLSVLTRGSTLKPKVMLLGGPNTYLPFLRECWRAPHPRDLARSRLTLPRRRRPSRSSSSRRMARSTTRRSAPCVYGLSEPAELGATQASTALVRYMTERPQGAPRRAARARRSREPGRDARLRRRVPHPEVQAPPLAAGHHGARGDRLDGGSTSSARPCSSTRPAR
jgi:hypothetical protein